MNISHRTGRLSRRRAASRSPLPLLHGYGRVICPAAWRDRHQIGKGRRCGHALPADQPAPPGSSCILQGSVQTVHLLAMFLGFRMPLECFNES